MRSVWKGHIRFSLVTIPIRLYNAIESSQSVSFRQLHKKDNSPIGYDKKCKSCGESVKSEDILKGYEYAPDQYVIMDNADFNEILQKLINRFCHTRRCCSSSLNGLKNFCPRVMVWQHSCLPLLPSCLNDGKVIKFPSATNERKTRTPSGHRTYCGIFLRCSKAKG